MNKVLLGSFGVGVLAYIGYNLYTTKDKIKVGSPKLSRNPVITLSGAKVFVQIPIMNASNLSFTYKGIFLDVSILETQKDANGNVTTKESGKIATVDDPSANVVIQPRTTTNIDIEINLSFMAIGLEIINYIRANGFSYKGGIGLRMKGSLFSSIATVPINLKV